ncbi:MAG TPA: lysophospholipid acyltransferase family protein [Streptosporangiaceae bacterium]|nr:lysophospholipid acyltransferase family protein [Streptosporangiaceae bacterium]
MEAVINGSVSPEPLREATSKPRQLRAIPVERLVRSAEAVTFWLVVAPLAARLPASLAYRLACWRGDWCLRYRAAKRSEIIRNVRLVLGDELGPEQTEHLAREFFRMTSCEAIDVMRLRGQARSLGKLVEIRGREHLDAALAAGKGAILCTAHFGSCSSAFSLLHASGYPLTAIGRTYGKHETDMSSSERRLWDFIMTRRLQRHRQRPNIEPLPGRLQVVVQAAVALRANEVVTISSDAAPLGADQARAIDMPFLGRKAKLLPGVVGLAQLAGAPVLMMFAYRCADYRHQVLEISPPVSMEGETATVFERCVAAIEAAVQKSPAHWVYWANTEDLADLGLVPAASTDGLGSLDSSSSSTAL